MRPDVESRAVVIGASIAGLCAARVLADHVEHVSVIDRDQLPEKPEFRRGVSQSRHLHILLQRGLLALEELFPGLKATLQNAGAVTVDWPRDAMWLMPSGWSPRFSHGVTFLSCSRHLLEWCLRQRVTAFPNVEFLEDHEVTGLLASRDGAHISGVTYHPSGRSASRNSTLHNLSARLVVDASGVRSRLPEWLEALGYAAPEETRIDPFLGYATRLYNRSADEQTDWKTILLQTKPPHHHRGGGLFPIEDNRWIVSLSGFAGDYPPVDDAGFLDFARSLRSPVLYEVIQRAEPLDAPIRGYRHTGNRLRHIHRMRSIPDRLLVMGDALCSLNPAYAQGMSVSALQALFLDACLRRKGLASDGSDEVTVRVRSHAEQATTSAWRIATSEDLRYPATVGGRLTTFEKAIHWYMDRVLQRATSHATVNEAFVNVLHLMRPPRSLFRPEVLVPTLFGHHSG